MRNTAAIFYRTFRNLTFRKLLQLLRLTLPHPILSVLAFYATFRAFMLAKKYFPRTNSSDGVGNAFRHALWCCLIMMYCCKVSSAKKSLRFCEQLTSLHEELFTNQPAQRFMDLHNNRVGMEIFMEMLQGVHRQFFETSFFINVLFEKTKTAKLMRTQDREYGNDLIYLHD